MFRKVFSIILALLAVLFWYVTFTAPMIAAATPAIISIALTIAAYFVWPKKRLPSEHRIKEVNKKIEERDDKIFQAKRMKDAGWSNISIASRLGVSENTVREILK